MRINIFCLFRYRLFFQFPVTQTNKTEAQLLKNKMRCDKSAIFISLNLLKQLLQQIRIASILVIPLLGPEPEIRVFIKPRARL